MKASYSNLMQSKYFSPAFNSAIFDGPIRIYFAQFHESMALKIYFLAQQKLASELRHAKELSKTAQANILIMIYPSADSFEASFGECKPDQMMSVENWNEDIVIGLRRPLDDGELDGLVGTLATAMKTWEPKKVQLSASPEL